MAGRRQWSTNANRAARLTGLELRLPFEQMARDLQRPGIFSARTTAHLQGKLHCTDGQ